MRGQKSITKKRWIYVIGSVASIILFLFVLFFVDPEAEYFLYSSLLLFLTVSFLLVFSVTAAIFLRIRMGVLAGLFVALNLFLRYFGFSDIIYLLILLLIFLFIEIFFRSRGQERKDVKGEDRKDSNRRGERIKLR